MGKPSLKERLTQTTNPVSHLVEPPQGGPGRPAVSVNGLAKRYGDRFKPPKLLLEMAKKGESFYRRFPPEKRRAVA